MQVMHANVDLRFLSGFLAVIDEGSVTAAASRLNLSQPALSRQIRELERRLSVTLFDRSPTKITLTAAGHQFALHARDLVRRADQLALSTRQLANGETPHFRVACPEATVRGVLAPFVADTGAPIFHTSLSIASRVYDKVLNREVDFAVNMILPPVTLTSALAATGQLSAYLSTEHPLAALPSLTINDLRGEPLILLTQGSGLRQLIDQELWPIRHDITVVTEPESSDLAIALAAAGHGICIDLMTPIFGGVQRPLFRGDGTRPSLQLYAAWEADHFAATSISEVVASLAQWDAQRSANYMLGNITH